jgi:hypothetical protein
MPEDSIQDTLKSALSDVYEQAAAEWGESNPNRIEQLKHFIDTAAMIVDHAANETPYEPEGA